MAEFKVSTNATLQAAKSFLSQSDYFDLSPRTARLVLKIPYGIAGFVEDKDLARSPRREQIIPALASNETVILDFSEVKYATQFFIQALIGEALKRFGEDAAGRLEFRNCSQQLKSVIELVVDYSFTSFLDKSLQKVDREVADQHV
jgi:hypothetical protein